MAVGAVWMYVGVIWDWHDAMLCHAMSHIVIFFLLAYVFLLMTIHDGEIVGLTGSSNGRSCEQHACCGSCVWFMRAL